MRLSAAVGQSETDGDGDGGGATGDGLTGDERRGALEASSEAGSG